MAEWHRYLRRRERLGRQQRLQDDIYLNRLRTLSHVYSYTVESDLPRPGAVFNLHFSPLGRTLLALYERKTMSCIDPVTRKAWMCLTEAHDDAINVASFIDEERFLTGSDDMTVRLWDLRKLSNGPIRTYTGHEGWVKNVEYCYGNVISSAFDGDIRAWGINDGTEGLTRVNVEAGGDDDDEGGSEYSADENVEVYNDHTMAVAGEMLAEVTDDHDDVEDDPLVHAHGDADELVSDYSSEEDADGLSNWVSLEVLDREENSEEIAEQQRARVPLSSDLGLIYQVKRGTRSPMSRMRISPDKNIMTVALLSGYIVLIYNLHLPTLKEDIAGFDWVYWARCTHRIRHSSKALRSCRIVPHKWPTSNGAWRYNSPKRHNYVELLREPENGFAMSLQFDYKSSEYLLSGYSLPSGLITSTNVYHLGKCIAEPFCLSHVIDKDDTQALALAKTMDASDDPKWSIYPSGLLFRNMERSQAPEFIKGPCFGGDLSILAFPSEQGVRVLDLASGLREYWNTDHDMTDFNYGALSLDELLPKPIIAHESTVLTTRFSPTQPVLVSGGIDETVAFYEPR